MATGNMLLGYTTGSIGDLTFSRVKGNQVVKARNRNPANPKTSRQMYQRAKFVNAVNFYKRGVQNLFKFAYEDKTAQESDFNAFMRHNVGRAILAGRSSAAESVYPAISNWITSVGSLNGPQALLGFAGDFDDISTVAVGRTAAYGQFGVSPAQSGEGILLDDDAFAGVFLRLGTGTYATFGDLCSALKAQFTDLQEGDIVTVTLIRQIMQGIGDPLQLMPSAGGPEGAIAAPEWYFAQFVIDSTSTTPISGTMPEIYLSQGLNFSFSYLASAGALHFDLSKSWQNYYDEIIGGTFDPDVYTNMSSCTAAVITFSRQTSNGLRVSTQEFSTSEGYQQLIELSKTEAFVESVLRSWDAADLAILEGGFIKA